MLNETNPEMRMFELLFVVTGVKAHEPFEASEYPLEQFVHAVEVQAVHHDPHDWHPGTNVAKPDVHVTQKLVELCVQQPVIPVPVMHEPFDKRY